MAFPETSVLDNFDRADNDSTPGSNWTPFMACNDHDFGIRNNKLYAADGDWNGYYYNASQFGPDCEVFMDIDSLPSDASHILYLRLKNVTCDAWQFDGYSANFFTHSGGHFVNISRVDNSVGTQLGSSISLTLSSGDQIGLRAAGNQITAYLNGAEVGTRTDNTYAAAGYLGLYGDPNTTWRYDNFGGGSITSVTAEFAASPTSGNDPLEVAFTNNSTTTDPNGFSGGSAGWKWEKNDGSGWVQFSTSFEPTETFTEGTWSIRLTATSNDGTSNTKTRTDYIAVDEAISVTAAFSASPTSGGTPLQVAFTNDSTTNDPGGFSGGAAGWKWDKNNGSGWTTFSTAFEPTETLSEGTWSIRLTATSNDGTSDTLTRTDYITVVAVRRTTLFPTAAPGPYRQVEDKPLARPRIPQPARVGVELVVYVADLNNRIIGELDVFVEGVTWRLNKVGRANLIMARTAPGFSDYLLRCGRRILIIFDNGLPNWAGLINPPTDWEEPSINLTCDSAEALLFMRRITSERTFSSATVGAMAHKLLTEAEAKAPVGVVPGNIWFGGNAHDQTFYGERLGEAVQDVLVGTLDADAYDVTGQLSNDNRYFIFSMNLYERRGADLPNVALLEGVNISDVVYREVGPITNAWTVVGAAENEDQEPPTVYVEDSDSINRFGLREDMEFVNDVSDPTTLEEIGANLLRQTARPRRVVSLDTADRLPARFGDYDVGDRVWLELPSYSFDGFAGLVRVVGRDFVPARNVCSLVLEEVIE